MEKRMNYIKNINPAITPFDVRISDKRTGFVHRNYFVGVSPFTQSFIDFCKLYNFNLYIYINSFIPNLTQTQIKRKIYAKENAKHERNRANEWYKNHKGELKSKPSWRRLNPDRAKEKDKLYYTSNRNNILKYAAIRRSEHREEIRESDRKRYAENKETICLNRKINRQNLFNSWVNREPFNGICNCCGKTVNYNNENDMPEFHHTIPENKTDTLYHLIVNLNSPDEIIWKEINNGGVVLLCHKCHKEITLQQLSVPNDVSNKMILLYENGMMVNDISNETGFERHTVAKVIKKKYPNVNLKRHLSINQIKEAKKLYNEGAGICELANKFNINRKTMSSILKSQ